MDVIKVSQELIPLIVKSDKLECSDSGKRIHKAHLIFMLNSIIDGEVKDDKAHRWIGYVQGCLVFSDTSTVEEMKEINFNN